MKNIEIKYQISSLEQISSFLSGRPDILNLWTREQTDIYFQANTGRLKLRLQGDSDAQLIFYQRPDDATPRESEYFIHNTVDGENLKAILEKSLGVKAIVKKIRSLYMFRNVRIHLDNVHDIGHFLEFESVIDYTTSQTSAQKNLQELLSLFTQFDLTPVTKSYADLANLS
jgi:predicted adenylyl cyclase CyaB